MKKFGGRFFGAVATALLLISLSTISIARAHRDLPRVKTSPEWRAKVDSVERWARKYCDSMISELRNGSSENLSVTDQLGDFVNGHLDSLGLLREGPLNLHGRRLDVVPMHPDANGGWLSVSGTLTPQAGEKYYLKVVPQVGSIPTLPKRVGKSSIWLVVEPPDAEDGE